jgi:FkbM family methyltransferase
MARLARAVRKLRLILGSDLTFAAKVRYLMGRAGIRTCRLTGGMRVALRPGSTDWQVFEEIFIEGAYSRWLDAIPREADVLLDLGANVGLSAIYLARRLPVTSIIAVEPDPGNFAMLRENLRLSGLESRSTAVQAFAGAERGFAQIQDSGNGAWGMRMGRRAESGIPVYPLEDLARSGSPMVVKCDIEGAERGLFSGIRAWAHLVRFVILELHTEFLAAEELRNCLENSGYRWQIHGEVPNGACIGVLGLERLEVTAPSNSREEPSRNWRPAPARAGTPT